MYEESKSITIPAFCRMASPKDIFPSWISDPVGLADDLAGTYIVWLLKEIPEEEAPARHRGELLSNSPIN